MKTQEGRVGRLCRADDDEKRRSASKGQTRPFALIEPRASFTLTSRHSPRQSSRRTRANAVGIRSLSVFGKNREWAGRDCTPRTQRRGRTVDGTMPRNRRMAAGAGGGRTAPRGSDGGSVSTSAPPRREPRAPSAATADDALFWRHRLMKIRLGRLLIKQRACSSYVCLAPNSGARADILGPPLWATNGLMRCNKFEEIHWRKSDLQCDRT